MIRALPPGTARGEPIEIRCGGGERLYTFDPATGNLIKQFVDTADIAAVQAALTAASWTNTLAPE
jgi:hypothetical protein